MHGLGVHSLEVPHGGVGGVSRENLDSGNLNSTAAEELDATNPKGVTTEQLSSGSGLCGQPQKMGCCHDGGHMPFFDAGSPDACGKRGQAGEARL